MCLSREKASYPGKGPSCPSLRRLQEELHREWRGWAVPRNGISLSEAGSRLLASPGRVGVSPCSPGRSGTPLPTPTLRLPLPCLGSSQLTEPPEPPALHPAPCALLMRMSAHMSTFPRSCFIHEHSRAGSAAVHPEASHSGPPWVMLSPNFLTIPQFGDWEQCNILSYSHQITGTT